MRRSLGLLAAAGVMAALIFCGPCWAALRAGTAKTVITPDVHSAKVYMAGFGHDRISTGVHDELYARCLALSASGKTLVLCSADLIGLFYDDVLKIREKVHAQTPQVTHLIVAATHDHEGPDTLGLWGPSALQSGMDAAYMDRLDDHIATTAVRAVQALADARMRLARDDHPLLALLQDDSRPPYVKDPHLFVMQLVSASTGKPLATLVNWSDHPETLGGKNTEMTADYPHWLCNYLEQHEGGTALFFQGSIGGLLSTLGDQVALLNPGTGKVAQDGTWDKARLFGTTLGELTERALKSAETLDVNSFAIRQKVIYAPLANDRFRVAGALGIFKGRKPLYTAGELDTATSEKAFTGYGRMKYSTGADLKTEVNYIQLLDHGRVAAEIATVPGEIYPELVNGGITRFPGADFPQAPFEPTLRAHLKSRYQFIFGLANDELGYIIPKCEWDDQPPWLLGKPERWYGEINSAGPEVAGAVTRALVELMEGNGKE
jgi:hypothetical protein